jgi:hypothetical protein
MLWIKKSMKQKMHVNTAILLRNKITNTLEYSISFAFKVVHVLERKGPHSQTNDLLRYHESKRLKQKIHVNSAVQACCATKSCTLYMRACCANSEWSNKRYTDMECTLRKLHSEQTGTEELLNTASKYRCIFKKLSFLTNRNYYMYLTLL